MDGITPSKQRIKIEKEPVTPEMVSETKSTVPRLPNLSSPGAMSDSSVDSLCSTEGREQLELPVFTPTVKCALRDGDCNQTIWNMVRILGWEYKGLRFFPCMMGGCKMKWRMTKVKLYNCF